MRRPLRCPHCHGDRWYDGPSGGAAKNIRCAKCRCRFNLGPFSLELLGESCALAEIAETTKKGGSP